MPSIPVWAQSSDVVTITLTQQDLSAAGALSDTSGPVTFVFATTWSSIDETMRDILKEVNGSGSTREHYIKLASTFEYSISYLLKNDTSDPAAGKKAAYAGRIFKLVFTYGTAAGSVETTTTYVRIESHTVTGQGRGELTGKFTLKPVDSGSGSYFVRAVA